MGRKRALLVGNGVNLTAGLKRSWEDVVRDAFGLPYDQKLEPRMKVTPFPLLIESAFALGQSGATEGAMQERLATQFDEWEPGDVHRRIIGASVPHVLTTNWDLTLEKASGAPVRAEKPYQKETRYSLYRRNILPDGKRIWHIHGSAQVPKTMVLGFEHYAGHLYVVRQVMVGKRQYKRRSYGPVQEQLKDTNVAQLRSWLEVALTHDLLIIGLRLDFAELGLWWLLTYRARVLGKSNAKFPRTNIYYACPRDADTDGHGAARKQQLRACGIETWEYDGPWEQVYARAFDQFGIST